MYMICSIWKHHFVREVGGRIEQKANVNVLSDTYLVRNSISVPGGMTVSGVTRLQFERPFSVYSTFTPGNAVFTSSLIVSVLMFNLKERTFYFSTKEKDAFCICPKFLLFIWHFFFLWDIIKTQWKDGKLDLFYLYLKNIYYPDCVFWNIESQISAFSL